MGEEEKEMDGGGGLAEEPEGRNDFEEVEEGYSCGFAVF